MAQSFDFSKLNAYDLEEYERNREELINNYTLPNFASEEKAATKYTDDDDFKTYQVNKYGRTSEELPDFDIGNKSQTQIDYEEYSKKRDDFGRTNEKVNKINGAHVPLAWTMRNIDNNKAKAMTKPFATLEEAKAQFRSAKYDYDEALNKTASKYGYSPDDIKEWQGRGWRGFISGTTEILNDMRDVIAKASLPITAGAGVGLGVGGPIGAVTGFNITSKVAMPVATLQDTAVKEYGSLVYGYMESHPDITEQEFQSLKKGAAVQALASGAVEAGVAALALPYAGKIAMQIPGAKKITGKLIGEGTQKATTSISKWLSTEAGVQFLKDYGKLVGAEITQEEVQQALSMYAEQHANEVGIAEKQKALKFAETPEEKAKIRQSIYEREQQLYTPGKVAKELGMTALQTFQGVGLIAGVGAAGSVRYAIHNQAQAHVEMASNINEQIDKVNKQEGYEEVTEAQETPVLEGRVEENVLAEQTSAQLDRTEAEAKVKAKEIDNQIASAETKIENADALGLREEEVVQLKFDLESLNQQKTEQEELFQKIGTERAIKQAQKETETNLEKVNAELEKADTKKTEVASKIEKYKEEGKTTAHLEKQLNNLDTKINKLEEKQEKLLSDKNKLETRTDVESVLKGKKTTMPSTQVVKREASIEKEIQQKTERQKAEAQKKLDKQTQKTINERINGIVKEIKATSQGHSQGYLAGAKEQITETRDIRKEVYSVLRELGVKNKEREKVDPVLKKILTPTDLIKYRKELAKRVEDIFEARAKAYQIKRFNRLIDRAKPLKGKPQKGKMTPAIQNKVNRMFALARKSFLEAQSIISELVSKFSLNPDTKLDTEEKIRLIEATGNEEINQLQSQINEIKDRKEKKKWNGKDKNREDRIKDSEELNNSVKSFTYDKTLAESENGKKILGGINTSLIKGLNLLNLGIKISDLSIHIEGTAFSEREVDVEGSYARATHTLTIRKNGLAVAHEIGHYFDYKLGELLGFKNVPYLTAVENIKSVRLAEAVKKLNDIIKVEINKAKNNPIYKTLKPSEKKYVTSRQEVFARVFNAMFNKINKVGEITREEALDGFHELISELTKKVSDREIELFSSFLNDIAEYNATGRVLDELEQSIEQIEEGIKSAKTDAKYADQEARKQNLPETVRELVEELEMAYSLSERSAEDIERFNDYVENLIETGRDIKAEKMQERKEADDALVQQAIDSIQGDNPTDIDKTYTAEEYEAKQKEVTKKTFKKWVNQCAKSVLRFVQAPTNTWATLVDTLCQDDKNLVLQKIVDYVPALREYNKQRLEYNEKFNNILKEVYGVKSENEIEDLVISQSKPFQMTKVLLTDGNYKDIQITKQQAITAWMYLQNIDVRQAIQKANGLTTIYKPEMNDGAAGDIYHNNTESFEAKLEDFLTEKDKEFANKLFDLLDEYYDVVNTFFENKYFISMPKTGKYTPLVREQEVGVPEDMGRYNFQSLYNSIPSSFINRRVNNRPVVFKPINELINKHFEETSFVMAYDDFNRIGAKVLSQGKNIIKDKYGDKFYKLVIDEFKNIANPNVFAKLRDFATTLFRNMSSSTMGYNITSAMKQALSFPVLGLELTPAEFTSGILNFTSLSIPEMIRKGKFLFDNSPILQERYKNLNIELAMIAKDRKASTILAAKQWNRFQNNMYILTRYGDTLNIVIGGWANYYAGKKRGLSHKQCMDMVERAALRYNQSSNVEDQTVLQIKGGLASAITMFKSDTMKLYNAQVSTLRSFLRGNISGVECVKRTAILTSNNLMSLLVDTAGLPTKKEFLATVLVGQLASLPLIGEFISELTVTAVAGLLKSFGDDDDDDDEKKPFFSREGYMIDPTANIAKLSYSLWKLEEKGFDKYEDDWWKAYEDFGEPMVRTLGIPAKPIKSVHSLIDSDVDDSVIMRLPTLIWTRKTLKGSYPDIYE